MLIPNILFSYYVLTVQTHRFPQEERPNTVPPHGPASICTLPFPVWQVSAAEKRGNIVIHTAKGGSHEKIVEFSTNLSRQNGSLSLTVYAHDRFPVRGGCQLTRRWGRWYLRNWYCAAGRVTAVVYPQPFRVRLTLLPYLIERSSSPSAVGCLDVHALHAAVK